MSKSMPSGNARVRRSCEPCRQKKTKCPAEQPICSFCRRLNQTCIYLPRYNSKAGIRRAPKVTTDRPSSSRLGPAVDGTLDIPSHSNSSWSPVAPEPPSEVLDHFVEIYREKMYFQPLPLFNLSSLREGLATFPNHLRWAFLALTLHHSNHSFYSGMEYEAIRFYTASSRSIAMDLSIKGATEIEVLQSICLLALCEIIAGEPARAWMTIGTVSRLETLRLSSTRTFSDDTSIADTISRCHWSIMILEKAFTPNFTCLTQTPRNPDYPKSASRPVSLGPFAGGKSHCPGLSNAHEANSQDLGINAYSLQVISLWGDIISYLHNIRSGTTDSPWLSTSMHNQLAVKVYELECKISHLHLLRNVSFPDRTPSNLSSYREYWTPWLLMQIMSHVTQCALNNPFIHLVALRGLKDVSLPRSFLQQTVDHALFNSRWVARLVQMCEDLSFWIEDPLIGQAIAATATVPWLFQFARDEKVAAQAKENLGKFETILKRQSIMWPHIAHKLKVLQALQCRVDEMFQDASTESTTIRFDPELLWELLNPTISQTVPGDTSVLQSTSESPSATIQITTKFVHPVAESQEDQPLGSGVADSFFQMPFGGFHDSFLEELLSESFLSGSI
ncbi:hypothetical protein BKA56DRAFT_598308 [Ilyonectria sp. MPI-CAGE-AT-0026]|nr:hypothetical protein BKA56DRAFT_598308 [Ilyonectria sp. MPI-CAGE-AT-0026]